MELNRGQHPHAKKGGEWDTQLKRFISPGPETWGNPSRTYGGASEIERTRWEEKFGDAGDAEGFNPIAWVEVKGGQDAAAHARIKNLERIAKQSEERAHESTSKLKAAGLAAIAANGMLPRSREKVDTSAILNALSPSTPPAMSRVRMLPDSVRTMAKERYNIETIDQLNARVKELETKYSIDKVREEMTSYGRVDTTPQMGHNTYNPPRARKAF